MITSFPPFVNEETEILILGSIPGVNSLTKQEYYGNKNNQFWKIMYSIFDALPLSDHYDEKIRLLTKNKIGMWDVLANCERKGSLDTNIKTKLKMKLTNCSNSIPESNKFYSTGKKVIAISIINLH